MKKFVFAMLMTVATLSASASPAAPTANATEPGESDAVGTGTCVWECSANGTIYQKPSLCAAACSTTCEPLCW